jgi:hypothetical protein
MTPDYWQKLAFFACLALTAPIMGCGAFGGAMAGAAVSGALTGASLSSNDPIPSDVLCSSDDSIEIKYYVRGSDFAKERATKLIFEHCGGDYEVIHHVNFISSGEIFAACLQDDGSLPSSFSCEYVAPESAPVGFGNTDPANDTW